MDSRLKQDIPIGSVLKNYRVKSKMTQTMVSSELKLMGLDISQKILSQIELGEYSIKVKVLLALSKLYNTPIQDFFADIEQYEIIKKKDDTPKRLYNTENKRKQNISMGENLKKFRIKAGMTQVTVSAKLQLMGLDVHHQIISQMELGKYSVRISVLLALAELYNTPVQDFFADLERFEK